MDHQPTFFTRYGGRTFVAFLCILTAGTLLAVLGKLTAIWVTLALGLKGMFAYRSIQQDKVQGGEGVPKVGG